VVMASEIAQLLVTIEFPTIFDHCKYHP